MPLSVVSHFTRQQNSASLTFLLSLIMSNRHQHLNKQRQPAHYAHDYQSLSCSTSLSLFFSCLLLLSPFFQIISQCLQPSLLPIPFGTIGSTPSLSGVRDSLHATDSEEIGFWMPQPQFIWLFNSFLLNQNTKTFPVFYLMLKIW